VRVGVAGARGERGERTPVLDAAERESVTPTDAALEIARAFLRAAAAS